LFSILIDFIGALPTIQHSCLKPQEETWSAFGLAELGALIAIFSFHEYNWTSLSYAVYLISINIVISSVIAYRQHLRKLA